MTHLDVQTLMIPFRSASVEDYCVFGYRVKTPACGNPEICRHRSLAAAGRGQLEAGQEIVVRLVLKVRHHPKYPLPWELRYSSILKSSDFLVFFYRDKPCAMCIPPHTYEIGVPGHDLKTTQDSGRKGIPDRA